MNTVHCIGDSHACFFSGWDTMCPTYPVPAHGRISFLKSYRLGPVLAYSLHRTGSSSRGRELLLAALQQVPQGERVMMCFGEIDCRAHLLRQAELQKKPVADVVADCVEKYFRVISEVVGMGFVVFVWGVIPSTASDLVDPEYPTIGTCRERNEVTRLFNSNLSRLCLANNIPFVSIFDSLLLPSGITDMSYYMDQIHLSQNAMPFALSALAPFTGTYKPAHLFRYWYSGKSKVLRMFQKIREALGRKLLQHH